MSKGVDQSMRTVLKPFTTTFLSFIILSIVIIMADMIGAFSHDPTIDLVNRVSECAVNYPDGRPIIVGVAGGSGSGKTTIAKHLLDSLGADQITYIPHDK